MQSEEDNQDDVKKEKSKLVYDDYLHIEHLINKLIVTNSSSIRNFADYYRRYISSYHPSVPTPPPNS